MKKALTHSLTKVGILSLAIATSLLPFTPRVAAETLLRSHGRCKLTTDKTVVFEGHCVFKHKKRGGNEVFVVELDNGQQYKISGETMDSLQMENYSGIHNVQLNVKDGGDKDVFIWSDQGYKNRLVVNLDTKHPPNPSVTEPSNSNNNDNTAIGAAIGIGIGALIGGLIGSGSQNNSNQSSYPANGTPVARLSDLVGAKGGQAEGSVEERGYRFVKGGTSGNAKYTYWLEPKTNYCVTIKTEDGRYQAIYYASSSDCQK
jgi:hypothetical protein